MSAINAARVFDYVNSQQHVLTGLLRDLVDAESPSSHPETHDEVRRVLRLALASVGFDSREVGQPGEPRHVFARPSERDRNQPLQLVVGHFDTVWPIGTLQERPFRLAGNVIHGPGSFDMKGGLVQLVIALRTIRDLRLEMPVVPMVFVNGDEEIGSRSSTRYIRLLARRAERAYVLEPALGADGKIKTSRKGIGRFTIMVHGKAAHAGLDPEGGASAILELSHVIQKLFALNDAERGITVNVGTIDGGIQHGHEGAHHHAGQHQPGASVRGLLRRDRDR
ncbi:MAG: M20/M25/M40 family metallo-hydrolase, partial [Woeseiaceae bacterium]